MPRLAGHTITKLEDRYSHDEHWEPIRGRRDLPQFATLRQHLNVNPYSVSRPSSPSPPAVQEASLCRLGLSTNGHPYPPFLNILGRGTSSTVFQIPSSPYALKKSCLKDNISIWQDFRFTKRVHDATEHAMNWHRHSFCDAYEDWQVPKTPQAQDFYREDHPFVALNEAMLPPSHRNSLGAMFVVERIPPVSGEARRALMELYFDNQDTFQEAAKCNESSNKENDHCLLRVYLGERESQTQLQNTYSSLRDFPLRLNMIEDIGLDTNDLASSIAVGLAIVHWECHLDAKGMKFVLGGTRCENPNDNPDLFPEDYMTTDAPPREVIASSDPLIKHATDSFRRCQMWMLDFDKASTFASSKENVTKRLVPAFLENAPYFPKPNVDKQLWKTFREEYTEASRMLTCLGGDGEYVEELCEFFVDEVERVMRESEESEERDPQRAPPSPEKQLPLVETQVPIRVARSEKLE